MLTPNALDRCINEDDWVRREFLSAVECGRNIVPVREESVELDRLRRSCPECMKAIFEHQIATIQHAGFAQRIATLIERYIPPNRALVIAAGPPTSAPKGLPVDISRIDKYAPAQLIGRPGIAGLSIQSWVG